MGRQDLQYSSNFYSNPTISLGEAVKLIKQVSKDILPGEYSIQLEGQAKEFAKTMSNVIFVFILASILLYMVLASLFNSFFPATNSHVGSAISCNWRYIFIMDYWK